MNIKLTKWTVWGFFCFAGSLLLCFLQSLYFYNSQKGFFTDNGISSYAAAAALLLFLVPAAFWRNPGSVTVRLHMPQKTAGCFSFVLACCGVYAGIMLVRDGFAGKVPQPGLHSALGIGAFFLTISLLFQGVLHWGGNCAVGKEVWLPAVPAVWFSVYLVTLFAEYTTLSPTAENLFQVFAGIFAAVFFLNLGRLLCGVEGPNLRFYLYGMGCGFICLCASAVPLTLRLLGIAQPCTLPDCLLVVLFFTGLYALSVTLRTDFFRTDNAAAH